MPGGDRKVFVDELAQVRSSGHPLLADVDLKIGLPDDPEGHAVDRLRVAEHLQRMVDVALVRLLPRLVPNGYNLHQASPRACCRVSTRT